MYNNPYRQAFEKYLIDRYKNDKSVESLLKLRPDWRESALIDKYEKLTGSRALKIGNLPDEFKNGVFINRRRYRSFAKKFHCPVCGKKRYAQVLNINEISNLTQKSSMTIGIRWLIIMIIGGLLLMGFFSIPMHFVNKAAANHAEELRQEQFEELREQYF